MNKIPENPGGGTVYFVTEKDHRYLKKAHEREEGGTPSIVGSIRAGLVMQLKDAIGAENIVLQENRFISMAMSAWKKNPSIVILGNPDLDRVAIFSFLIKYNSSGISRKRESPSETLFLHHNFVSALLNDLFGIQTRGGCACAGPYVQQLLGIDYPLAKTFEKELLSDDLHEYIRPGSTRLNLHYSLDDHTVGYVIDALNFVADEGWKLMPQYTFYPETGEWIHFNNRKFSQRKWLGNISYTEDGTMKYRKEVGEFLEPSSNQKLYKRYLAEARETVKNAVDEFRKKSNFGLAAQQNLFMDPQAEKLRWFVFPSEVLAQIREEPPEILTSTVPNNVNTSPFVPLSFEGCPIILSPNKAKENEKDHEIGAAGSRISNIEKKNCDNPNPPSVGNKNDDGDVDENFDGADFSLLNIDSGGLFSKVYSKKYAEKWPRLPFKDLLGPILSAIKEYDMIKEGDRILLGLSGGKDSLSLLHALHAVQKQLKVKFEIGAVTVDPQTSSYNPEPLIGYLKELGVPYFFESQGLIAGAKECKPDSICAYCARMKRGIMYNTARREGYNVIALGQHMDDMVESFVMSIFHNGLMRTQKANYVIDEGDIRVIRPMIYVRERTLKNFAWESRLPVINENCMGSLSLFYITYQNIL